MTGRRGSRRPRGLSLIRLWSERSSFGLEVVELPLSLLFAFFFAHDGGYLMVHNRGYVEGRSILRASMRRHGGKSGRWGIDGLFSCSLMAFLFFSFTAGKRCVDGGIASHHASLALSTVPGHHQSVGGRMHFSGLGGFFLWGFSIYPRPLSFFRGWQHHCDCCHSGDGRGCFRYPVLFPFSTAYGGRLGQGMAGDSELGQTKRAYFFKSFLSTFFFYVCIGLAGYCSTWFGVLLIGALSY